METCEYYKNYCGPKILKASIDGMDVLKKIK